MSGLIGHVPGLDDSEQEQGAAKEPGAGTAPVSKRACAGDAASGGNDAGSGAVQIAGRPEDKKRARSEMTSDPKEDVKLRAAGGSIWHDPTLSEWDPSHPRIFVGDLGKDVTDSLLLQSFSSAYPSVSKAKVIRDRHTGRTKGYGFVSFEDESEFRAALREMHGKYIGSRPVKLRKSNWDDRDVGGSEQVEALKQMGYRMKKKNKGGPVI